jgi:pyruvate formate lyase activating enzyme
MIDIRGFIPNSLNEWPGHISSIVFFGGCNLLCPYCHNSGLEKEERLDSLSVVAAIGKLSGVNGVVLSGGEATLQDGLEDFIRVLRNFGHHIKLSTNGTRPDVVLSLLNNSLLDCICVDYKTLHSQLDSVGAFGLDAKSIPRTFDIVKRSGIEREYRTTLCPATISKENIVEMAKQLDGDGSWILQQYIADIPLLSAEKAGTFQYSDEDLEEIMESVRPLHPFVRLRK